MDAVAADDPLRARALGRIGSTLHGKYRIDRLLGVGGMACVYAATHRNGNRVAIKMLHPEISLDADLRARFLREGYVANSLEHPGAVRVLDDDVGEDGAVFLVMELLEGDSIESVWERWGGRLRVQDAARVALDALDTLAAAHRRGVIHRDIKPENMFLTRDGRVKLLDFGIARLRDGASSSTTTTRTGRVMGTPAFMPPEQALGRRDEIDARSDVWAMGATMFTLISGRHVHPSQTIEEAMVLSATRPAPSLSTVAPDAHRALVAVVDRALAFRKEARWDDAGAMRQALEAAYATAFGAAPNAASVGSLSLQLLEGRRVVTGPGLDPDAAMAAAATQASTPFSPRSPASTTVGVTQSATRGSLRPRWAVVAAIGAAAVAILAVTAITSRRSPSHAATGGTSAAGTTVSVPVPAAPPSAIPPAEPAPSATVASEASAASPPPGPAPARPAPSIGHSPVHARSHVAPAPAPKGATTSSPAKGGVDPYAP